MILKGNKIIFEKHEPVMRSCWKCNGAHKHLKKVNSLHVCFECGKYWIFDKFIEDEEQAVKILKAEGVKEGESSTKIDKGYRIVEITIEKGDKVPERAIERLNEEGKYE